MINPFGAGKCATPSAPTRGKGYHRLIPQISNCNCEVKVLTTNTARVEAEVKAKVETLKVEEKKKEEEAKQNKLRDMQQKVTALNPNLHIVSLGYSDSVTVKIGNGKRTSKEEFNEAVNACKNAGGKYNYKEKTWTIKVS